MSAETAWKVAMECGAALASERAADHKRQSANANRSDACATAWEHDRAATACLAVASDCAALPMPPAFAAVVEAEREEVVEALREARAWLYRADELEAGAVGNRIDALLSRMEGKS